jgi:hypothetical protein
LLTTLNYITEKHLLDPLASSLDANQLSRPERPTIQAKILRINLNNDDGDTYPGGVKTASLKGLH